MSDTPTSLSRMRIAMRVVGAAMWVLVCVWIWRIWERREQDSQPQSRQLPAPNPVYFQPWELPDFALADQHDKTVRKTDLAGRQWVASFIFTRCTEKCPMIAGRMRDLRDAVPAGDARIVTITVDPEHDTPAVLKRYAKTYGSQGNGWLFLTGPEKPVYALLENGFKVNARQAEGADRKTGREVTHDQRVLHIDENGRVIGTYDGNNKVDMERLRRAISNRAATQRSDE